MFQWQQKFQWQLTSNGNQKISHGFGSYVIWACFKQDMFVNKTILKVQVDTNATSKTI